MASARAARRVRTHLTASTSVRASELRATVIETLNKGGNDPGLAAAARKAIDQSLSGGEGKMVGKLAKEIPGGKSGSVALGLKGGSMTRAPSPL